LIGDLDGLAEIAPRLGDPPPIRATCSIKRVASAVGDGATAVRLAHEYLAAEHADELLLTPQE